MLEFCNMKIWAWLPSAACAVGGLLLSGCGAASAPKPPAPAASALAGNWLLVGPMPINGLTAPTGFRLAMTFDVNGSNVEAVGSGDDSCGNTESSFGIGTLVTGTIADDGSFTLQMPTGLPQGTLSIQGTAPKANQNPWPGSYTASFPANIVKPVCDTNPTGTFTATSFPLVSGVYVGTGSLQTSLNGVPTPVTFQVTLQQGGTVVNPVTGKALLSSSVLAGSIRVQGSPCFTSGTTGSTPRSLVEGNAVHAAFMMDDGSTLQIVGFLTDATETHLATNVAIVTGGQCGTFPSVYQLPGLDRQS